MSDVSRQIFVVSLSAHHCSVVAAKAKRRHKKLKRVFLGGFLKIAADAAVGGNAACNNKLIISKLLCRGNGAGNKAVADGFGE